MCRGSTCIGSFGSTKPINFDKGSIHFVGKNEGVGVGSQMSMCGDSVNM